MKRLLLSAFTALLTAANFAATECVVYSPLVEPASALRLSTISDDPDADETSWSFPSSYTGHRAVCRLPEATSNDSFIAWLGGESYSPGDWMGVSTARDFPVIGLTKVSPICNRLGIWSGASDRDDWNQVLVNKALTLPEVVSWIGGDEAKRTWYRNYLTNRVRLSKPPVIDRPTRVRVVRYAVDDTYCYSAGVPQRTVLDKVFYPDGRNFLCEADFLGDGKFDIDWEFLKNEAVDRLPSQSWPITNTTYLVVIGDGPTTFSGPFDTNTTVNAMATMITRRFERTRSTPKAIGLAGGSVLHGSRPTFVWSMPDEDSYAKRYGSSYTAFRIQVLDFDRQELVWTSDTMRAPVQNDEGNFVWQAPPYAGSQTTNVLPVLTAGVHYQWRVSMTNAKFPPAPKIANDKWATPSDFTVSDDPEPEPVKTGDSTVECVVYSRKKSNSSLHVSTVVTNAWERPRQWDFPSSYTGHRAVCRLTSASPNDSYIAWIGGSKFTPGELFGCSNGRVYPTVGLTRVSPVCNRIDVWTGVVDRDDGFDLDQYGEWNRPRPANPKEMSGLNLLPVRPTDDNVRIRIVRYAVNGFFTYSLSVTNRVVLDRVFNRRTATLTEANFLSLASLDIDYEHLKSEVVDNRRYYNVTNMSYLVAVGDGPVGFNGYGQTNDYQRVNVLSDKDNRPIIITRRFDKDWAMPNAIGLKNGNVIRTGSRPTFVWSMPEESRYANLFGSSYTSFRIELAKKGEEEESLFVIGPLLPTPIQNEDGKFEFTLPEIVGDQTPIGQKLAEKGDFLWCVAMYNAKFKPTETLDDSWSNVAEFTVADEQ